MSCYLNYGIVSMSQIIYDLWPAGSAAGAEQFQRGDCQVAEISYAHAFGTPHCYNQEASVPQWARHYFDQCRRTGSQSSYTVKQMEDGSTDCDTWNAMQHYLVRMGKLHNNARMTWCKTVVYWQKGQLSVNQILHQLCYQLCYLNDLYALDGLSSPSYAGLLWCMGWCDSPKGGILSEKPSSRYRVGRQDFEGSGMDSTGNEL